MNTLQAFRQLIDRHMVLVVILALLGTFACRQTDLMIDLPAELVSVAVIFPLVFSIASAYTRREDALKSFASLKANAIALYYAHRDWPQERDSFDRAAELVHDLLERTSAYFKSRLYNTAALRDVYEVFGELSHANEKLRDAGVSPTEISRVSQYLRDAMMAFETMRNIAHYRTPVTLRVFSRLFLSVFPILFTPYFAFIGFPEHSWVGYAIASLYAIVLVGLDNIQEHLEDPYDAIGPDDLHLDIADEYLRLVAEPQRSGEPAQA